MTTLEEYDTASVASFVSSVAEVDDVEIELPEGVSAAVLVISDPVDTSLVPALLVAGETPLVPLDEVLVAVEVPDVEIISLVVDDDIVVSFAEETALAVECEVMLVSVFSICDVGDEFIPVVTGEDVPAFEEEAIVFIGSLV